MGAAPDAYVTACLMVRALAKMSPDSMVEISAKPIVLPRVNFGKFEGRKWDEVDSSYLKWLIEKSDFDDEDMMHTAKTELAERQAAKTNRSPV